MRTVSRCQALSSSCGTRIRTGATRIPTTSRSTDLYHWNWGIFFQPSPEGTGTYLDMLLMGLRWTIVTALCAWAIALVFTVLNALMLRVRIRAENAALSARG